ncbi:MAG: hypothetical protein P1P86_15165 [Bacteroidales bacterium]|nr:hypothetical protein [Bacteroidales bacterium]
MKTKGTAYTLLGLSLCITLLTACKGKATVEEWIPEKNRNIASATAYINERCPEMVDPDTRLDSVFLSREGHLSFYYTLPDRDYTSISSAAFHAYMLPEIIVNIRTNRDLKMHRDSSLTMVFRYKDRNGVQITELTLGPESYR